VMVIPATVFWLLLGLAALGLLALGVDLDGLMAVAIAALLLSLLMAWLTWPATMQALLFVGTTLAVLAGLQRLSQRRRSRAIPAAESANEAVIVSGFGASDRGRVRWRGQSWAAINLASERPLLPGESVLVMGRDGTHLQVLPLNSLDAPPIPNAHNPDP